MKFVVTKTADQLDLQALHRVRERLAGCEPYLLLEAGNRCATEGASYLY